MPTTHSADGKVPPRPASFDWCPTEIWHAFHCGQEFRGFPHKVVEAAVNGLWRETISRMLADKRIESIAKALAKAELLDGVDRDHATYQAIYVAATASDMFIDGIDRNKAENHFKKTVIDAKKLLSDLEQIDHFALQSKTNLETNFSETGKFLDTEKLSQTISAFLLELIRECELPPPERGEIIPRKLRSTDKDKMVPVKFGKQQVSRNALSIIKARLLKRELSKLYKGRLYQLIADLVTLSELLPDPMTEESVRKA